MLRLLSCSGYSIAIGFSASRQSAGQAFAGQGITNVTVLWLTVRMPGEEITISVSSKCKKKLA